MNLTEQSWIQHYQYEEGGRSISDGCPPSPPRSKELTPLSLMSHDAADALLETELSPDLRDIWERVLLEPTRTFLKKPGKSLRRDFVSLGWQIAWALRSREDDQQGSHGQDLSSERFNGLSRGRRVDRPCPPCPESLVTLIELLHTGSLIIDDIEDQSETRRGQPCLHHQIGIAPALNIGNWLYFVSASLIEEISDDLSVRGELYQTLNRVMLRCHQGQAIDVSYQVPGLSRSKIRQLTELSTKLKTGVLVGFSMQLGAIYFGLSEPLKRSLYQFGERLGLGLQMYDDVSGLMNTAKWHKGCEDLSRARLTWAWAWLAESPDVSDETFRELTTALDGLTCERARPISELLADERWRFRACQLRDRCLHHLSAAPNVISEMIDDALDDMIKQLNNAQVALLARHAIGRLRSSYL